MKHRFKSAAKKLTGKVKFGSINMREQRKHSPASLNFLAMFDIVEAPIVKLWNTSAVISDDEMEKMRTSAVGITEVAEKCMNANGVDNNLPDEKELHV